MKVQLVIFIFSASCFAQNAIPPINKEAPEVELRQLLQAPSDITPTLSAFRGKAVVMEFWATWCGGCVAAIPHLNELAEQYKDKPVVYLSVTDESSEVVESFLKKRPMSGWIGIDKDGATFERYGILGRPQTVLIDPQGVLRLPAQPDQVNAALIDELISGKPLATDAELNRPDNLPMELVKGAPPPLLQVLIRPAASPAISGNSPGRVAAASGGRIEYYGVNLRTLLYYADHVRGDRIIAPPWFDQNVYDASIAVPSGRDDLRDSLLDEALTATFSLKMRRESRPTNVYVLSSIGASKLHPSTAKTSPGFSPHPGQFTGVATSILRLTHLLSQNLDGAEVIDETGLNGLYDFDLVWQKGNSDSLQESLRNQLGLAIRKDVRDREYLVVSKAVEPTTW
jgi:uncharacterized protein (TIGR03435 family)